MTEIERLARGAAERETDDRPYFENGRFDWDAYIRAILQAMREPSEGMLKAAFVEMNRTPGGTWKAMKASGATPRARFDAKQRPRWQAMIDHILSEAP